MNIIPRQTTVWLGGARDGFSQTKIVPLLGGARGGFSNETFDVQRRLYNVL